MLSYFFDTVGYLSDSGLLSDFYSLSSIAITIAICRKVFSKGV